MMESNKILATVAGAMEGPASMALMRLAEVLRYHGDRVTVVAQQSVQDIEPEDILVGSNSMRLRGLTIPYEGMRIETRIPIASLPTAEDIMAGEACVISYGGAHGDDRAFLTVVGHDLGKEVKMHYTAEAIDVAATHSMNAGTRLLISEGITGDDCTVIDACSMTVDEEGVYLGKGNMIPWSDISAMTTQDTLSLAIGRKRLMTISES